jgi:peptidoglycan hydrolase-like protein with peptidoglycan-binding domain
MPLTSPRFASNKRLQDAALNKPPLMIPEKSDAVGLLQQALFDLGYKMPISFAKGAPDAVYGQETAQAVRKFQIDQKFWNSEWDGKAGKDTLTLLDELFQGGAKPKDLQDLAKNLGYSMQAVNYVLRTVKLKAPNWDKYRGDPSWEAGTGPKDALDICLYDKDRPTADDQFCKLKGGTTLDYYRIKANLAKKDGCGNCGENSILAFMFLYDMGVRPIDRMSIDADHAFVVIGRTNKDDHDWKNWGSAAVVCDPWGQGFRYNDKSIGTYPGSQFGEKMTDLVPEWTSVQSDFRVE